MGQFVTGLDARLLNGEVDLTVHSSKDVPTDLAVSILQLGHLERAPPHDLLLFATSHDGVPTLDDLLSDPRAVASPAEALAHLPPNAHLGTVSVRRQAMALHLRPDLLPIAVRGAVETRLNRLLEGRADALLLAAGLRRLAEHGGLEASHKCLPFDWTSHHGLVLPAKGHCSHAARLHARFGSPSGILVAARLPGRARRTTRVGRTRRRMLAPVAAHVMDDHVRGDGCAVVEEAVARRRPTGSPLDGRSESFQPPLDRNRSAGTGPRPTPHHHGVLKPLTDEAALANVNVAC